MKRVSQRVQHPLVRTARQEVPRKRVIRRHVAEICRHPGQILFVFDILHLLLHKVPELLGEPGMALLQAPAAIHEGLVETLGEGGKIIAGHGSRRRLAGVKLRNAHSSPLFII